MEEKKEKPEKKNRDESRIREPFPPEETPQPPQVMDTTKPPDPELRENAPKTREKDKKTEKRD